MPHEAKINIHPAADFLEPVRLPLAAALDAAGKLPTHGRLNPTILHDVGTSRIRPDIPSNLPFPQKHISSSEAPELVLVPPTEAKDIQDAQAEAARSGFFGKTLGKAAVRFMKNGSDDLAITQATGNTMRSWNGLGSEKENITLRPDAPQRAHRRLFAARAKAARADEKLRKVPSKQMELRLTSRSAEYGSGNKRNQLIEPVQRLAHLDNLKKNRIVYGDVVLSDGRIVPMKVPRLDDYVPPFMNNEKGGSEALRARYEEIAEQREAQDELIATIVKQWTANNPGRDVPPIDQGGVIDATGIAIRIDDAAIDKAISAQERVVEKAIGIDIFANTRGAMKRILNDPNLTPDQRKHEMRVLEDAIALSLETQEAKKKQLEIANGTDKKANRINKRANRHKNLGKAGLVLALELDESVAASKKQIREDIEKAREKTKNFREGKLDVPEVNDLDLRRASPLTYPPRIVTNFKPIDYGTPRTPGAQDVSSEAMQDFIAAKLAEKAERKEKIRNASTGALDKATRAVELGHEKFMAGAAKSGKAVQFAVEGAKKHGGKATQAIRSRRAQKAPQDFAPDIKTEVAPSGKVRPEPKPLVRPAFLQRPEESEPSQTEPKTQADQPAQPSTSTVPASINYVRSPKLKKALRSPKRKKQYQTRQIPYPKK